MIANTDCRGTPNTGLAGATLGFFIGFAAVSLFGITARHFEEVLQLGPVATALLIAAPALSGSLLRIPFAAWVDVNGGKKPLLVLLMLAGIGMSGITLLLYVGTSTRFLYVLFLLFALLSGCGIATFSVGIAQVTYWFTSRRLGGALGTYGGVGNLAPGLFSFLLPYSIGILDIKGSYLVWTIFVFVGAVTYLVLARDAWYFQLRKLGAGRDEAIRRAKELGEEFFPTGNLTKSLKNSASEWQTWGLVAIYFTSFGGFIALTAWFPTYWQAMHQTTLVIAGTMTAIFSILASLLRVVGGKISDSFGGKRLTVFSLLLICVAAFILTLTNSFVLSICAVVILACGMGFCNAAVFKLVPLVVPDSIGGTAGWVGGIGAFGGFVIPPLMALFVKYFDTTGYARGFLLFILLGVVSLAIIRQIRSAPS